ncbi:MAG: hypothetical protein LBS46_03630 [Dysgonamonadaceae bacterium]|jgi:hypothetical protein|nr:hypothetical protein [Dysgonamonadaceae bacterium]
MMRVKMILTVVASLMGLSAYGQTVVVNVSIDSAQILIGEQTRLHLEIAADKNTSIQLPFIADTLMQGVEVLNITIPDTIDLGNNRMKIQYDYLITSFDSALYMLPPFQVIAGIDTVYSNQVALKVSTLPVDTESGNFYDIKDVWKPPFVLTDYADIFYAVLGMGIVVLLILYLISRWKKHKPILPFKKEEIIVLPPHVWAIQALDTIKSEKLWQQGKDKEYQSQLSDVIRGYIDKRFGINAMEMTSSQTLQAIRGHSEADMVFAPLKQMLLLSDLAKFAKYHPLPDENERSLMNAYLFVNSTTPVETTGEEEKEDETKDDNNA